MRKFLLLLLWWQVAAARLHGNDRQRQPRKLVRGLLSQGVIPNQYIVQVRQGFVVGDLWRYASTLVGSDARITRVFEHAFYGFVIVDAKPSVLSKLDADYGILKYEENRVAETMQEQSTDSTQWGLDYVSYPLDNKYPWNSGNSGRGVEVYVIDTGINIGHKDFEGRAKCAQSLVDGEDSCDDGHSHGTHVAGIIGGKTYGIAKGVSLFAVKVLNRTGKGGMDAIAAGVEWVVQHRENGNENKKMIINLSVGGGKSQFLNEMIEAAADAGILVVGAAANGGQDACNFSPGSATDALVVGAIADMSKSGADSAPQVASFSNYGRCVDIWAPGEGIGGPGNGGTSSASLKSGTSQAAPHVTGIAAIYMQSGGDARSARNRILNNAREESSLARNGSPDLAATYIA